MAGPAPGLSKSTLQYRRNQAAGEERSGLAYLPESMVSAMQIERGPGATSKQDLKKKGSRNLEHAAPLKTADFSHMMALACEPPQQHPTP